MLVSSGHASYVTNLCLRIALPPGARAARKNAEEPAFSAGPSRAQAGAMWRRLSHGKRRAGMSPREPRNKKKQGNLMELEKGVTE